MWSSHLIAVRPPDCCELRGGRCGGRGGGVVEGSQVGVEDLP